MSSANLSTVNSTIGQIVFYTISTIAINSFTGTEAGGAQHCQILRKIKAEEERSSLALA